MPPLVSIICLCYNHERFVQEAIQSVLDQTYQPIEIIIVDDASTDGSIRVIESITKLYPSLKFISLKSNLGNCSAFNTGFFQSRGDFVVDFSTDDIMLPDRIEKQVQFFQRSGNDYGVVFTDASYIDENGKIFRKHFQYLKQKGLLNEIPTGDVYESVLKEYFICSPTMLVKREVLEDLKGYDETLAYEDFDFWVRSSRIYKYGFLDEVLTKVRRSAKSLSTGWYVPGDTQLHSTYLICKKALMLNRTDSEARALVQRVRYEFRQSVFSENRKEARLFYEFLCELTTPNWYERFFWLLNKLPLPLSAGRKLYHRLRFS